MITVTCEVDRCDMCPHFIPDFGWTSDEGPDLCDPDYYGAKCCYKKNYRPLDDVQTIPKWCPFNRLKVTVTNRAS